MICPIASSRASRRPITRSSLPGEKPPRRPHPCKILVSNDSASLKWPRRGNRPAHGVTVTFLDFGRLVDSITEVGFREAYTMHELCHFRGIRRQLMVAKSE